MKNPHIIHKTVRKYPNGRAVERYLCIQAVHPTPEKSSYQWHKVTCKNCRKRGTQFLSKKKFEMGETLVPVYFDPELIERMNWSTPLADLLKYQPVVEEKRTFFDVISYWRVELNDRIVAAWDALNGRY